MVTGEGGGTWYVTARDGEPLEVTQEDREAIGTATVSFDSYQRMASGQVSPSIAMQNQLTKIDGEIHPITLLGRWIARAQGADDAEMKREAKQRRIQEERAGLYAPGGDHDGDGLLDYRQLYALWERQNWRATELDFSVDREQWVVTPREAQESTIWSLGSFYVGEERVTADLAPFLQAAPTGEIELFLATQLVDEARHAAFFDRFGAEVMCLRPTTSAAGCARWSRSCCRPGARCSTTGCATSRAASRRSRTTSTCSWRASRPTTWSWRASSP